MRDLRTRHRSSLLARFQFGQVRSVLGAALLLLLSSPGQSSASSGGPDAYGYTWADSLSGGPTYDYVVGPGLGLGLGDEDSVVVPIGFNFEFYGVSYSQVRVHSNGAITFGSGGTTLDYNNPCPLSSTQQVAAPFWDDLDPGYFFSLGDVYAGTTTNSWGETVFVAEWWWIYHYWAGDVSVEVQLYADGRLEFHYTDVDLGDSTYDWGASASVGLVGSSTLEVSCDSPTLWDAYAIGFYPPGSGGCTDADGDGVCVPSDCDDLDATVYPGAWDVPGDGIDQDCDGFDAPLGDDDDTTTADDDDIAPDDDDTTPSDDDDTTPSDDDDTTPSDDDDTTPSDDDDTATDDDDTTPSDDDDTAADDDDTAADDDDSGDSGPWSEAGVRFGCSCSALVVPGQGGPEGLLLFLLGFLCFRRRS